MKTPLVVLMLALSCVGLTAQEPTKLPAFEVASIRPHDPSDGSVGLQFLPRRYVARNLSVRSLLVIAYRVAGDEIVNGPSWIDAERYDIEATIREADAAGLAYAELADLQRLMLRTLLAERFSAAIRETSMEVDGHALVVDRKDGRLGPQLTPSSVECPADPESPPAETPLGVTRGQLPQLFTQRRCGLRSRAGGYIGQGVTMDELLMSMRMSVGTPLVNETNLTGLYDVELSFDQSPRAAPVPVLPGEAAKLSERPSLRRALEEQLGLRLEPRRVPAKGLEIIRIERPTPN